MTSVTLKLDSDLPNAASNALLGNTKNLPKWKEHIYKNKDPTADFQKPAE